jgi:hypothetical protein
MSPDWAALHHQARFWLHKRRDRPSGGFDICWSTDPPFAQGESASCAMRGGRERGTLATSSNGSAQMIPEHPQQILARSATIDGTLDGSGAADHDMSYRFGRKPNVSQPFPFSTHEYARLLILRSRIQSRTSHP